MMEKYRFIYIFGNLKIGNGDRDLHAVNAVFDPNIDYEYDEGLDLQIETQEQMDTVKNITIQGGRLTAWG